MLQYICSSQNIFRELIDLSGSLRIKISSNHWRSWLIGFAANRVPDFLVESGISLTQRSIKLRLVSRLLDHQRLANHFHYNVSLFTNFIDILSPRMANGGSGVVAE